jgi:hypothetical protein
VLRASAAAERAGVPAVAIISSGFLKQAEYVTRGLGLPAMAIAEFPGVPMTLSSEEFARKVEEVVLPQVIDGLSRKGGEGAARDAATEPGPRDIVFSGSFDAVQEHFHAANWSDGLPVVPPSRERVERFLQFTERDAGEIIASLPLANRQMTVWNVAVNGVMAGCRPEYMPILLAVADAVADPAFRMEDAGSTPGWEPLIVLNGPIAKQLGFNSGQGVMRVGRQSNTSVGRFLRLMLRNVAGYTHAPEGADKGTIGLSFNVVLAENEDACAELGWPAFSADRGYVSGENVVTVQSVVAISAPTYSGSESPDEHARIIADVIGQRACGYWSAMGMVFGNWHPLIVLGPAIAKVFAANGWDKARLRNYLYENVKIPASLAEYYAWNCGLTGFSVNRHVSDGLLPPEYGESEDPDRPIPVFQRAEWIGIVVAGDSGRNQSRGYVNNHVQGVPVSRRVVLPGRWETLLAESGGARP